MSTSMNSTSELSINPRSSKKRKNASEATEIAKKKRKHDKIKNDTAVSEDIAAPKKDKKKKRRGKPQSELELDQETQEAEDVAVPDAPDLTSPEPLLIVNGDQVVNGTDSLHAGDDAEEVDASMPHSQDPSCFYEKRLSLQLPIPAVSLATPASSILSLHLAPLLLTYFPPAEGIVLSFSNPVLSAIPNHGINLPLRAPKSGAIPRSPPDETFAKCADGFGACWVWLTVTFLVFQPEPRDQLKGWTNVTSEGFVGLVSYNYFQTAIGKSRIPKTWVWDGPMVENYKNKKRARKGRLRDEDGVAEEQEEYDDNLETYNTNDTTKKGLGAFLDADGNKVSELQIFHVVDVEMVPGHEKDKWTLQIDGSLLSSEEEATVVMEERQRFENVQNRRSRSKTPGFDAGEMPLMSGALPFSRIGTPS